MATERYHASLQACTASSQCSRRVEGGGPAQSSNCEALAPGTDCSALCNGFSWVPIIT